MEFDGSKDKRLLAANLIVTVPMGNLKNRTTVTIARRLRIKVEKNE
jgi:hypothetical protein